MASDAAPSPLHQIVYAIENAAGIPADDLKNAVVFYEQQDGLVGALSLACCSVHAVKVASLGIATILDWAVPDLYIRCE